MSIAQHTTNKWNLIAGLIMLLLGGIILFNPFGTLLALAFYIGIGFIITGTFYIFSSMEIKSGWYLLVGTLDVVVGLILVSNLGITASSLPIIFALWSITVGIIQTVGALEIKRIGLPWGWSIIMGIAGICFGLLILSFPFIGAITISTIFGIYAIFFGLLQLAEYQMSKNMYRIVTNRPSI